MDTPINDGGPAFPTQTDRAPDHSVNEWGQSGMALRDWFAGMALQGILNNTNAFTTMSDKDVAANCYTAADALIAARTQTETLSSEED